MAVGSALAMLIMIAIIGGILWIAWKLLKSCVGVILCLAAAMALAYIAICYGEPTITSLLGSSPIGTSPLSSYFDPSQIVSFLQELPFPVPTSAS